jgi:hypothetical protein
VAVGSEPLLDLDTDLQGLECDRVGSRLGRWIVDVAISAELPRDALRLRRRRIEAQTYEHS